MIRIVRGLQIELEGNTLPPFSLQYDGQRLTDLLLLWTKTEQVQLIMKTALHISLVILTKRQ